MSLLEDANTEVLETDVLVIGGGYFYRSISRSSRSESVGLPVNKSQPIAR